MEPIIQIYLTNREVLDITKTFPNSLILRDYNVLLENMKKYISQGYSLEIYYEDEFIITMQDILSRFNQLEHIRTYRIIDKNSEEFGYIYKPGGNKK